MVLVALLFLLSVSWLRGQGGEDYLNDWRLVHPDPHNGNINGVAYGGGRYVLACDGGLISVSGDLEEWENRVVGTGDYNGVEFVNGRFVVVGDGGAVAWSVDGEEWTTGSAGVANQLNGAAWHAGRYYVVGAGGVIVSSSDLVNWTTETSPVTSGLNVLGEIAGVLFAAGDGGGLAKLQGGVWTAEVSGTAQSLRGFATDGVRSMFAGDRVGVSTEDGTSWTASGTYLNGYALGQGGGRFVLAGNYGGIDTSTNGRTWRTFLEYQAMGMTGRVNDMVFANGEFVAVGSNGLIMCSVDGVEWAEVSSTAYFNDVTGIANAGGLSVAVGKKGSLWVKKDGESKWRNRNIGYYYFDDFRDVVTNGSRFVIARAGQGVFTSENGEVWDWVSRDSGNGTMHVYRLAYGDGVFLATKSGNEIVRSTDGVTWEPGLLPDNLNSSRKVDYVNGAFYVPGISGKLYRSVDGLSWTEHVVPSSTAWWAATAFGNGLYVAIQGQSLLTSPDGVTWTVEIATLPFYPRDVIFSGGQFIMVGAYGGVMTSGDGRSWLEQSTSTSNELSVVAEGGGEILAGGVTGSIVSSPQGTFWKLERGFYSGRIKRMVYAAGQFVAVGSTLMVSEDGISWEPLSGGNLFLEDIAWGNGVYVATGINNRLLWSANGRSWESVTTPETFEYVAFGKGYFLALSATKIYQSTDGRSWTQVASVGGRSITFAGDKFFLMGNGSVRSSEDGVAWSLYSYGGSNVTTNVVYGNGMYLAGTNGFKMLTSADGVSWTEMNTAPQFGTTNLHFFDGLFWASAGGSGLLYSSPDGVSWTKRLTGLSLGEIGSDMASSGEHLVAVSYANGTSSQFYALDIPQSTGGEFSFGSLSAYQFGEVGALDLNGTEVTVGGMEVMADGSRYLMGTFQSFLRFSPSVFVSSTSAEPTGFIAKFDANGVVQWARTSTDETDGHFKITAHTMRANGNLVFAGDYQGGVEFGAAGGLVTIAGQTKGGFGGEITSDGAILWVRNFGRAPTLAFGISGIAIGADGTYYTSGQFEYSSQIGGQTLTPVHGNVDLYLAAYSSSFNGLWGVAIATKGVAEGRGLEIDASGHLYLSGVVNGATTFVTSSGEVTSPYYGNSDSILASYDSTGSFRWYRHYGGPQNVLIERPILESDGNHLTVPVVFSDRALLGTRIYDAGSSYDLYALSVDTTWGNARRVSFVGELSTSGAPRPMAVLDENDNLFVTGLAGQGARFGSATAGGASADNLYVTMMDNTGRRLWTRFFGREGTDRSDLVIGTAGSGELVLAGVSEGPMQLSRETTVSGGLFQAEMDAVVGGVEPPLLGRDVALAHPGEQVVIHVLSNDEAPVGQSLSVLSVNKAPSNGTAEVVGNTVVYTAPADFEGSDRFRYQAVTDTGVSADAEVVVTAGGRELREGWAYEERGNNGTHLKLTRDGAGRWHLGYISGEGFVHAWDEAGVWQYEIVPDSSRAISGSLMSDSQGGASVLFYDPGLERFRFARREVSGTWSYEELYESDNLISRFEKDQWAMEMGSDDQPRLYLGRNDGAQYFERSAGGAWSRLPEPFGLGYPALGVAGDGTPWLAGWTSGYPVSFSRVGGSWPELTLDLALDEQSDFGSSRMGVAFPGGIPAVAFSEGAAVKLARWGGTTWVTEELAESEGQWISLASGADGLSRVLFYESESRRVELLSEVAPGSWETKTLSAGEAAGFPVLAPGSAGLRAAYSRSEENRVVLAYPVPNTAPVAVLDVAGAFAEAPVLITPLENDFDLENDVISFQSVDDPANGSVSSTPDGVLIYVPDAGFSGQDEFAYHIADGRGGVGVGTIRVSVLSRSAFDQDEDGLNDQWQALYGLPTGSGGLDGDLDGILNRDELRWGSNPLVFNSAPQIELLRQSATTLRVRAQSAGSRGLVLQESGDLSAWSDRVAAPEVEGPWIYGDYPIGNLPGFFRVRPEDEGDADGDFIGDWLEANVLGTSSGNKDTDGDGRDDFAELLAGSDPRDFFDGEEVSLNVISGNGRVVQAGEVLPELLGVRASGADGRPLAGIPIRFSISEGLGELRRQSETAYAPVVTPFTDASGRAWVVARAGEEASGTLVFSAEFADPVAVSSLVEMRALVGLSRSPVTPFTFVSRNAGSVQMRAPASSEVTRYFYTTDGSTPDGASASVLPGEVIAVPLASTGMVKFVAEKDGVFGPLQTTFVGELQARQLVANENGAWSVGSDGVAHALGLNTRSQLGFNTTESPVASPDFEPFVAETRRVPFGNEIASMAMSLDAAVVLDDQDRVWETLKGIGLVQLGSLAGSSGVAAGADYRLAVKGDGTVARWGYGDLGSGSLSVVPVNGLANVTRVFAGFDYAFALAGGDLMAWGKNPDGNLGLGHANEAGTPTRVDLSGVEEIVFGAVAEIANKEIDYGTTQDVFTFAPGARSTFAVTTGGEVYAWGANGRGELGLGHRDEVSAPALVGGLDQVVSLVASQMGGFAVALDEDGVISSWGRNDSGQLGDGSEEDRAEPTPIVLDERVTEVALGRAHVLALREDGRVLAWGANEASQLGNGTTVSASTPSLVEGLQQIVAVAAAADYSLALRQDGALFFFGRLGVNVSNGWVSVGMETVRESAFPVIITPAPTTPAPAVLVDANGNNIDDGWENRYFGYTAGASGPFDQVRDHAVEDFDFDGKTNLQEFLEGTHPFDPHSCDQSEGSVVGATEGQFSVGADGAARYSLAIELPGGAAGIQPELSVNYHSKGANGILGQGWSLGGYGMITRGPTNLVTDGFVDGVDFDDNDVFYLNGQRLIAVAGEYGADGTEYRTEQNTFARIYSRGEYLGGPDHFEVWTRSGLIERYGVLKDYAVSAYQVGADQFPRDGVLTWPVESLEDRAGNWVRFEYEWTQGNFAAYRSRNFLLGRIIYGSAAASVEEPDNIVDLVYRRKFSGINRTGRRDQSYQFIAGELVVHDALLESIEISRKVSSGGDGYQLFRRYDFDYDLSFSGFLNNQHSVSRRTVLQKITETGSDGRQRAALELTYSGTTPAEYQQWVADNSFCPTTPLGSSGSDLGVRMVDLNRDGLLDYVRSQDAGAGVTTSYLLQTRDAGARWQSGASHSVPVGFTDAAGNPNGTLLVDLNRDGQTDILKAVNDGTGFVASAWLATPTGWEETPGYAPPVALKVSGSGRGEATLVTDLNGDGLPDFVFSYQGTGGTAERMTLLNTGEGWSSAADLDWFLPLPLKTEGLADNGVRLLDVNGDGLPDLLQSIDIGGEEIRRVWLNTGQGWERTADRRFFPPTDFTQVVGFEDLNGDGLQDIAMRSGFLNTGAGWIAFALPVDASEGARFLDLNGDGLLDLVQAVDVPSVVRRAWLNVGYGFEELPVDSIHQAPIALNKAGVLLIDINGDGADDIVDGSQAGQPRCWLNQSGGVDLLVKIQPQGGAAMEVDYVRLNEGDGTYEMETAAEDSGMVDVINGSRVVRALRTENGIGGQAVKSYRYRGLRHGRFGEGSLGFRSMSMTDEQTGVTTTSVFRQDYPLAGVTESVVTKLGAQVLSREETEYALVGFVPNVPVSWFSHTRKITESRWDLGGQFMGQTTSEFVYDDYGNVLRNDIQYGGGWSESFENVWSNDEARWEIGRLQSLTAVKTGPEGDSVTRNSAFVYNETSGYLEEEVEEPGTEFEVRRSYVRNAFGNVVETTTSGAGFAARTKAQFFDFRQDRVVAMRNELGHETAEILHPVLARVASKRDANGLQTHYHYDGFGSRERVQLPTSRYTTTKRFWAGAGDPPGAMYREVQYRSGELPVARYYDVLDRLIRVASYNRQGELMYQDSEFEERGWLLRSSRPYLAGEVPVWSEFEYDAFGRRTKETLPDGAQRRIIHQGRVRVEINEKNQQQTVTTDVMGHVIQVKDARNSLVETVYNADGNPVRTVTGPVTVTTIFNRQGNPTQVNDPSSGTLNFTYNALGEMLSKTDAKGQVETVSYDALGRVLTRTSVDGVEEWTWDTGAGRAIGLVAGVSNAASGNSRAFEYDELGRLKKIYETVDGETFVFEHLLDDQGRLGALRYPGGYQVDHRYAWTGALASLEDASDGSVLWGAVDFDGEDRLVEWIKGNGVKVGENFDHLRGFKLGTIAENATTASPVQDYTYGYDALGVLTSRSANLVGAGAVSEVFSYDNLNRVTGATLNGVSNLSISYDNYGNILSKSDVGSYTYGENGASPHAVTSVTGVVNATFAYDANGNRISGNNRTITYNGEDKPVFIGNDLTGEATRLRYGVDDQLIMTEKAKGGGGERIVHVGNLYDRTHVYATGLPANGTLPDRVAHRYSVQVEGQTLAVYEVEEESGVITENYRYLHRDHLGSVVAVSNEAGVLEAEMSFDAFGRRRSPDWSAPVASQEMLGAALADRGYTGHRSLDEGELIHMKGRVYDPLLGRFLSPDPFIQAPKNIQNYNRYSYVLNSPLSLSDPSGFFFRKLWKALKSFVSEVAALNLKVYDAVADAAEKVFGKPGKLLALPQREVSRWIKRNPGQAIIIAVTWGAGSAAGVSSSVTGSSLLKTGVISGGHAYLEGASPLDAVRTGFVSAWTAGAFNAVGDLSMAQGYEPGYEPGSLEKVFAHGLVGGASSAAQGNGFERGFLSAASTQALSPMIDANFEGPQHKYTRVGLAAAVGGMAAKLGGGNFKDGAMTGAASRLYNDEAHPSYERTQEQAETNLQDAIDSGDQSQIELRQNQLRDVKRYKYAFKYFEAEREFTKKVKSIWDTASSYTNTLIFGGSNGTFKTGEEALGGESKWQMGYDSDDD
jgi:RHS repeat-associated protein